MTMRGWAQRRTRADKRERGDSKDKGDTIKTIQEEAKENGATLANDGKGGLDPKVALKIFRRDKWQCKVPNCTTPKKDLDLDHIAGHPLELDEDPEADEWLKEESKKPKTDDPDGLHVLCLRHHDAVHSRERALEQGDKPKPLPDSKNTDDGDDSDE